MLKYTPEQYNKILSSLPQEVRDVVLSSDTTKHLWKIGEKHDLQIDKVGLMHDLSMDVMMGIIATKDFVKELQNTLQIGALEASVLARDIDENVFKPIKETMTHLYAGRAPYKPSSSLVQYYEEEDEHPALSKENILKEIEDPEPSQVKKEATVVVSKVVSELGGKELEQPVGKVVSLQDSKKGAGEVVSLLGSKETSKKPVSSRTNQLVEYHEEISEQPISKPVNESDSEKKGGENNSNKLTNSQPSHPDSINLTTSPTNNLNASSILNQLASIKLNQAFVMPKGPEGIRELRGLEADTKLSGVGFQVKEEGAKLSSLGALDSKKENKILNNNPLPASPLSKREEKSEADPSKLLNSQASKLEVPAPAPKIDPYRERI